MMKSEVAAEMVRVKLVKQVKEMVAKAKAHELMKDKWEMVRASAEYEDARARHSPAGAYREGCG